MKAGKRQSTGRVHQCPLNKFQGIVQAQSRNRGQDRLGRSKYRQCQTGVSSQNSGQLLLLI